jgi:hypothetical protein
LCVAQLQRGADPHDVHAGRIGTVDVGRDERHACAAGGRDRGHGVALPSRGRVAEEADRIERLAGAACADDHMPAGEVVREREGIAQQ